MIVHIIEKAPNYDGHTVEVHADTVDAAKATYLQYSVHSTIRQIIHVDANCDILVYPEEICTMESLSENVFVATWQPRTGMSV